MTLATDIALAMNQTTIRATGLTYTTPTLIIPRIGYAAAYASGDAVGDMFEIPNVVREGPKSGVLHSAMLLDLDDEGIALDIVLFNRPFTATADNAAFAVSDFDLIDGFVGILKFTTFSDFANNQVSTLTGIGMAFNCYRGTSLYGQAVTRGAPNIASANDYWVQFAVLQD